MKTGEVVPVSPAQPQLGALCKCGHVWLFHRTPGTECVAEIGKRSSRGVPNFCSCGLFKHADATPPAPSAPLPGEVALAFRTDNCGRCGRVIDVNEPIYGVNGGGIWCAACNDAVPRAVPLPGCDRCGAGPGAECNAAAHDAHADVSRFRDAPTSVLMRRAATALGAWNETGYQATADEGDLVGELRARAERLERAAAVQAATRPEVATALLRAIGEVRS